MSRDVIKASSFSALFAETSEPTTAQRFTSSRVRFRELLERLEQAEAREQRAVANAVERTRAEVEAEAQAKWGEATQALESVVRRVQELTEVEYEVAVEELVDLATSIASKIVRREIAKDDELAANGAYTAAQEQFVVDEHRMANTLDAWAVSQSCRPSPIPAGLTAALKFPALHTIR